MASSPTLPPSSNLGYRMGAVAIPVGRMPMLPSWPLSSLSSPALVRRSFATTCFAASTASTAASLTASVGSPLSAAQLRERHVLMLNVAACAVTLSASWLIYSAILSLLALGRAAKSIEKLLDVTREELPDMMAAVRLSGLEISNLTMDLSELGEGIGQQVRSSTRAIRIAEDRLCRLTMENPTVSPQLLSRRTPGSKGRPAVANAARSLREGIAQGRAIFGAVLTLIQLWRWVFNLFAAKKRKKHLP